MQVHKSKIDCRLPSTLAMLHTEAQRALGLTHFSNACDCIQCSRELRNQRLNTFVKMVGSKRPRDEDTVDRSRKSSKLEDDRIAASPTGVNLIQANDKTCTHEVAWPPGIQGSPLPPSKSTAPSAKEYAFPLDPFQQTAINSLETGQPAADSLLA